MRKLSVLLVVALAGAGICMVHVHRRAEGQAAPIFVTETLPDTATGS